MRISNLNGILEAQSSMGSGEISDYSQASVHGDTSKSAFCLKQDVCSNNLDKVNKNELKNVTLCHHECNPEDLCHPTECYTYNLNDSVKVDLNNKASQNEANSGLFQLFTSKGSTLAFNPTDLISWCSFLGSEVFSNLKHEKTVLILLHNDPGQNFQVIKQLPGTCDTLSLTEVEVNTTPQKDDKTVIHLELRKTDSVVPILNQTLTSEMSNQSDDCKQSSVSNENGKFDDYSKSKTSQGWSCFKCNAVFKTSLDVQRHLNSYPSEEESMKLQRMILKQQSHVSTQKQTTNNVKDLSKEKFQRLHQQTLHKCRRCVAWKNFLKSFPKSCKNWYSCSRCNLKACRTASQHRCCKQFSSVTASINSNFPCVSCHISFPNSSLLRLYALKHQAEVGTGTNCPKPRSGDAQVRCPDCLLGFSSISDLAAHISLHGQIVPSQGMTKYPKLSNQACQKELVHEEGLGSHMKALVSEELKPKQCNICKRRFLNNSALGSHLRTHNGRGLHWECLICNETYRTQDALRGHVICHSKNGTFICPQCKKVFPGYLSIRKHISKVHRSGGVQYSLCKKHNHSLADQKEFTCSLCEKQFKRKDKLKEHIKRMHFKPKVEALVPIQTSNVLKKSKKTKNKSSDIFVERKLNDLNARFTFKCQPCLLGFKRRGMLVNHIAKYHPNITLDEVPELKLPIVKATQDFFCHLCEKVYKSNAKRKAHIMKFHPGALKAGNGNMANKPFVQLVGTTVKTPERCQWCHKQYATYAKLLQHIRSHHSDKAYPQMRKRKNESQTETPVKQGLLLTTEILDNLNFQEHEDSNTLSKNEFVTCKIPAVAAVEDKDFVDCSEVFCNETFSIASSKVQQESILTDDEDDLSMAECLMKLHANLPPQETPAATESTVKNSEAEILNMGSGAEGAIEWLMDLTTVPTSCHSTIDTIMKDLEPRGEAVNVIRQTVSDLSVITMPDVYLNVDLQNHSYDHHITENSLHLVPPEPVYSPYPPH